MPIIYISREKLYRYTSIQKCAQSNMTRACDEVYCKLTSNLLENVNRDVFRGACTMTSDSSYIFVRVQRSELLTAH